MDDKFGKFERALRDLQIEQWFISQHAVRWRSSDADDIRQFATHARTLGKMFDQLLADAGALVGAEPEMEGLDALIVEFSDSVIKQADKLDEDERERHERPPVWSARLEKFV